MNLEAVCVVGAGPAGARAVESLRKLGWDGAIHLISSEMHLPYERPAVSKAMLFGKVDGDETFGLWNDRMAAGLAFEFHRGVHVERIDRSLRTVVLSGGKAVSYQHLILATGARPRRLSASLAPSDGVFYLRTADDARILRSCLGSSTQLAVVGAGLIGLEVAAGARRAGHTVTVIEAGPEVLSRGVPSEISQAAREYHCENGVEILLQAKLNRIEGRLGNMRVLLDSGKSIECEAVLVAIGAEPNIELAEAAGLATDRGILVDGAFRTSDPHIFAAGDVCSFLHPIFETTKRLESWQNAEDHGRHVARSIMGQSAPYTSIPWFWSEQFDRVLHVVGVTHADSLVERAMGDGDRMLFYLDGSGRLIGAAAFGLTSRVGRAVSIARRLIAANARPSPRMLAETSGDLAALIESETGQIGRH